MRIFAADVLFKKSAFTAIDSLMISAMEIHQEELELLLGLVKNLTIGTRVKCGVCRAVLGLEPLPENPDIRGGIGPAKGFSITHSVGVVSQASQRARASGRHDFS